MFDYLSADLEETRKTWRDERNYSFGSMIFRIFQVNRILPFIKG